MTDEERDRQAAADGASDRPEVPGTAEDAAGVLGTIQDVQLAADTERPALDDAIDSARAVDAQREAEALAAADELDEDELDDDDAELAEPLAGAPVASATAVGAASAEAGRRGRKGQAARSHAAAPSVSEQAVHINDRASAVFVIALVVMFAGVLLAAMLVGPGGLFGNVLRGPAPTPVVEVSAPPESVEPSVEPSASASTSPSASGSPAASPSASPSGVASPSPSAS